MKKKNVNLEQEFMKITKVLSRIPTATELYQSTLVTREMVRQEYTRYTDMVGVVVRKNQDFFESYFTPQDFSQENHEKFEQSFFKGKARKNILAFTAVPGCQVNLDLLSTFRSIAKSNNATLLCLTTGGDKMLLDRNLKADDIHVLTGEFAANENLIFRPVECGATTVNPAKSLARHTAARGGAIVVPSPKQVMHLVPNMGKLPRGSFSTGAITEPDYNLKMSGVKAKDTHFFGAYLFRIHSDRIFLPYNIDALPDMAAIHMGVLYKPNGTKRKLDPSEIMRIDGDDHAMIRSPRVTKVLDRVQKLVRAHAKVSHDTYDMHVSNHHNKFNKVLAAQMAEEGNDKIEKEIQVTRDFLKRESEQFDKVYCVVSNHNEALARYGSEARYLEEDQNWKVGHHLAIAQQAGLDPVDFAMNHYEEFKSFLDSYFKSLKDRKFKNKLSIDINPKLKNVSFLRPGETLEFGGYKLNYHGSEGAGGARGTFDAMRLIHAGELSNAEGIITGHTHTSSKNGRSINVGTSTALPHEEDAPGYVAHSPNAWMNSFAFAYQPKEYKGWGTAQLFLILDEEV